MDSALALIGAATAFVFLLGLAHRVYSRFQRKAPEPLTDADIERVAREGDIITAIRWHRELHGSDLAVAKATVENIVAQPSSAGGK